ncbi:ClbS/DfsB family four-helix bundle protein, partial [Acinetobacter sp. Colony158]
TNSELYEKSWYNQWTMGRMIQLNTASPYLNAKNRVSKWLKIQNFQPRV